MRYVCACPSCGFRLTRRYYFRLQDPLRAECPGCRKRLHSIRWLDYIWSLSLFTPFGILFFYTLIGKIAWWLPVLAVIGAFVIGYLLFPYITKMALDEETNKTVLN
jgi:hypothetical protein